MLRVLINVHICHSFAPSTLRLFITTLDMQDIIRIDIYMKDNLFKKTPCM